MKQTLCLFLVCIGASLALSPPSSFDLLSAIGESSLIDQPPAQWFIQELDHFNAQDQRQWKQRYFVNDSFWANEGPIFFQIGGEGAIGPSYVTELQMVDYAQKHGALLVALEHRFYGQSHPLPTLSTSNLAYLSSMQALADAANFISWVREQYKSDTVITFGCSYPGNLAAWFRLKYPHLTKASVASSAPVQATLDFFQYLDVVDQSLTFFTGVECDARIRQATTQIQSMLTTASGRAQLAHDFNLCSPSPLQTQDNIATFMSALAGNWMGVVQYNDEEGNPVDITYLCNRMLNTTQSAYNAYIGINNLFTGGSCLDVSYTDSLVELQNITEFGDAGVGIRQWIYQTCTEFGYYQTTDSTEQPFGNLVPLQYYVQMCKDVYGFPMNPNVVNSTNIYYGGRDLPADGPSNILFVNGHVDPWHSLGVTEDLSATLRALVISDTGHCANVLPARSDDSPALIQARQQIAAQIDSWLSS